MSGLALPSLSTIVSAAIALVLGLTIHEFAHAWTAHRLGDPTPKWAGRVTLNPLAHLDPIGAIMLVLMIIGRAPIAWGKPVPINPAYMRWGRRGAALATAAGPLSNFLLALVMALLLRLASAIAPEATARAFLNSEGLQLLVFNLIIMNVVLASFNLIPIPPLDGFGILEGIAPPSWDRFLSPLRQYGIWILLFLVMAGSLLGRYNPLRLLYDPLFEALGGLVLRVAGGS